MKFNVIIENHGKFEAYDIIPYLKRVYEADKRKLNLKTKEDFKNFIIREAKYQWWSRCEYEIILVDWPGQRNEKKIDVYWQIMLNIDLITEIFMKEIGRLEPA